MIEPQSQNNNSVNYMNQSLERRKKIIIFHFIMVCWSAMKMSKELENKNMQRKHNKSIEMSKTFCK